MPMYHLYEWNHAIMQPWRAAADATKLFYQNPLNPIARTKYGRTLAAWAEVFERTTRRYGKPEFGLGFTVVDDNEVIVTEKTVWSKPFCNLIHFQRDLAKPRPNDPKILLVAPMSGHYATLLRGTVERLLPEAEVYITDWVDARNVPVAEGHFDLDDYIDYLIEMLNHLGPDTHIVGVCQPSVPVLSAVSVMESRNSPNAPASMILMGGPIDTRRNPTAVNKLAEEKPLEWFRDNVIMTVPFPNLGLGRAVYPGFLQLTGFMSMNMDRHMIAQKDFFMHLVRDDGDSAEKHRDFYDEYLAVMDLTAEFYLQTIQTVFIDHALPNGTMTHRGEPVDPGTIKNVALMTVEGENDDITGKGQTEAAHDLCANLPDTMKAHYEQPRVGHYGVFNGSRFRKEVAPRMLDFMRKHQAKNKRAKLKAVA
ncbi:MAG: polyhydroxyalkanoate depolymerase [Pseudomonadota bacterium]